MFKQATAAAQIPTQERQHERRDARLEVNAKDGHQFFTGFTENISAGGLFVQTYQTLPLGSRFDLAFRVPGVDYDFDCMCEVRWVREYDDTRPGTLPGMGVNFLNLNAQETELLDGALSRLETMFYDDEDDFGF